ncbi:DoxX family protein [Halomonas sp. LR5S13]|uniref:DoxX family protein n=1 Tax=Halomonas rhizosphaerae TaxID=3043296 RepID=UPI0024A9CC24|nr:DoxX family protein [Halomonas rhizosphaerae]MDI5921447.1 DoxX family protein [Halomonas rhizosphaerae]
MTKTLSLLLLRISLGGLLLIWGVDKIVNVEHGLAIADNFYGGLMASETLLPLAGAVQMLVGLLVVIGLVRRWVYPLQLIFNAASLVAVSASIIDPWGWCLEGTNALFYPSLIIFAASLVVMAFREEDRLSLDAARQRPGPVSWEACRRCS